MLDHMILTVSDVERSLAFYETALKPLNIKFFLPYKGDQVILADAECRVDGLSPFPGQPVIPSRRPLANMKQIIVAPRASRLVRP
jgi:catechol 2,3-dioxygenase-like lactoylglutathione lyase family enzyme